VLPPTVPLPLHAQARAIRSVPQHWLHLNNCASAVQARGRADSADEVNCLLLRRGLWQLKARRSQREAPRSWRVTQLTSRSSMHMRAPAQSDASARRQGATQEESAPWVNAWPYHQCTGAREGRSGGPARLRSLTCSAAVELRGPMQACVPHSLARLADRRRLAAWGVQG
jgi:hypothetical protein